MARILLGVSRAYLNPRGYYEVQHTHDVFEVELADDGSEFLSSLWLMAGGLEVLRLPL